MIINSKFFIINLILFKYLTIEYFVFINSKKDFENNN